MPIKVKQDKEMTIIVWLNNAILLALHIFLYNSKYM